MELAADQATTAHQATTADTTSAESFEAGRGPAAASPDDGGRMGRRLVLIAALVGLAALAGLPGRATVGARLSGDEPHYLLTATSLAEDGDLDIADELATTAYRDYHEVPIDPQTAPLAGGRRLSPHDPLLPAVLAVPMGLGGWAAAKATLAAIAAATGALTAWLAVRRFDVGLDTATVVVLGAFGGIPLAAYGTQVYPELPAALILAIAVAALTHPRVSTDRTPPVVALVAMVALPWLAVKYVPLAAAAGSALLVRLRRSPTVLVVVLVVVAAAVASYLAAHRVVYGGWTAYAAGDHFVERGEFSVVGTEVDLLGRSRRLGGLLVDRVFGLAAWSPLWALLPPAVGLALADRRPITRLAVALVAVAWLTATFVALTMHGWWVPGRQGGRRPAAWGHPDRPVGRPGAVAAGPGRRAGRGGRRQLAVAGRRGRDRSPDPDRRLRRDRGPGLPTARAAAPPTACGPGRPTRPSWRSGPPWSSPRSPLVRAERSAAASPATGPPGRLGPGRVRGIVGRDMTDAP